MSEAAYSCTQEFSASARLSFSQFLRRGSLFRSNSVHDHDSHSPSLAMVFSSGTSSPMTHQSLASKLSNSGRDPSRVHLSPLQAATTRRRARTQPREISAAVGAPHLRQHPFASAEAGPVVRATVPLNTSILYLLNPNNADEPRT